MGVLYYKFPTPSALFSFPFFLLFQFFLFPEAPFLHFNIRIGGLRTYVFFRKIVNKREGWVSPAFVCFHIF